MFFVRFGELFQNIINVVGRESIDPRLDQTVQRRLICFKHHIITCKL